MFQQRYGSVAFKCLLMQMPSVTRHQCPAPPRWPEQHCKITIAVLGLGSHPPQEMDPLLFVFLGMGLPHPGLRKKQDPKTRKRLSILVGWDLLGEKKLLKKTLQDSGRLGTLRQRCVPSGLCCVILPGYISRGPALFVFVFFPSFMSIEMGNRR